MSKRFYRFEEHKTGKKIQVNSSLKSEVQKTVKLAKDCKQKKRLIMIETNFLRRGKKIRF